MIRDTRRPPRFFRDWFFSSVGNLSLSGRFPIDGAMRGGSAPFWAAAGGLRIPADPAVGLILENSRIISGNILFGFACGFLAVLGLVSFFCPAGGRFPAGPPRVACGGLDSEEFTANFREDFVRIFLWIFGRCGYLSFFFHAGGGSVPCRAAAGGWRIPAVGKIRTYFRLIFGKFVCGFLWIFALFPPNFPLWYPGGVGSLLKHCGWHADPCGWEKSKKSPPEP